MPISFNTEEMWPAERAYNFKVVKAAVTQVRNGDNAGKDQLALELEVVNSPESNGYKQNTWIGLYHTFGQTQFLQLVQAITGEALRGDIELTDDDIVGMLTGGMFKSKIKHRVEDDVITSTQLTGKIEAFDPELENVPSDNGEFANQF